MKPITPAQVGRAKGKVFPPEVFQAFNELIAAKFVGQQAKFTQDEVVERIVELMGEKLGPDPQKRRAVLFDKGWLNVEAYYEKSGWVVSYDRPGYNETYAANWIFVKKRA